MNWPRAVAAASTSVISVPNTTILLVIACLLDVWDKTVALDEGPLPATRMPDRSGIHDFSKSVHIVRASEELTRQHGGGEPTRSSER
ncbi:MAG TPA: hypothetical protein VHT71_24970 [Methylomirabilota bacterium]|nr:hypothetical protein [Methylomirabilota bacterium]